MTGIDIFCNVLLQVGIIFAFLTIFFFSYVTNVEKEEFEEQINFIVDNIYKRYEKSIQDKIDEYNNYDFYDLSSNYISNSKDEHKQYIKMFIYGMIDMEQEKLKKSSIKENEEIKKNNDLIYQDSIYYVKLFVGISISLILLLTYIYKLPITDYIKEAFIVLFFIFVVEFIFLNLIVKKYITANPNYIKNKITDSIINYIKNNKWTQ